MVFCSISLKWKDRSKRQDPRFCAKENRNRIVGEIKNALNHSVILGNPPRLNHRLFEQRQDHMAAAEHQCPGSIERFEYRGKAVPSLCRRRQADEQEGER